MYSVNIYNNNNLATEETLFNPTNVLPAVCELKQVKLNQINILF